MKLLLDTQVVLANINDQLGRLPKAIVRLLEIQPSEPCVGVASLWEIAIKARLAKLDVPGGLHHLAATCEAFSIFVLPILAEHVLAEVAPLPPTRDPFDRLLLAQAGVEGCRLVTVDRALLGHPLAWRDERA